MFLRAIGIGLDLKKNLVMLNWVNFLKQKYQEIWPLDHDQFFS
jgi:hypothetical protein